MRQEQQEGHIGPKMIRFRRQSNCSLLHISSVMFDVVMEVRLDVRSEVGEEVRLKDES